MSRGHRKMAAETTRNIPAMTILDPGINTSQTIIFKYASYKIPGCGEV